MAVRCGYFRGHALKLRASDRVRERPPIPLPLSLQFFMTELFLQAGVGPEVLCGPNKTHSNSLMGKTADALKLASFLGITGL